MPAYHYPELPSCSFSRDAFAAFYVMNVAVRIDRNRNRTKDAGDDMKMILNLILAGKAYFSARKVLAKAAAISWTARFSMGFGV